MKNRHAYIISALLLVLFSLRILIPVCLYCAADDDIAIEQQDEKSVDAGNYDIICDADLPVTYITTSLQGSAMIDFPVTSHSLPPVHYMSIPTPPPWHKS